MARDASRARREEVDPEHPRRDDDGNQDDGDEDEAIGRGLRHQPPLDELEDLDGDRLAPAGGGDGLAGCIARRQYLGSRTSYAVELAGGLRLSVDRSGEGHDRFAIGDAVMLLLDPARSLAIAP